MSTEPRPGTDRAAGPPTHVPQQRAGAGEPARPPVPGAAAPPRTWSHPVLKSLLGAWALAACSAEETAAVEEHLTDCAGCADEAVRLRDAVALLHPEDSLDLDPTLRSRVLAGALTRRPARIPVPDWAAPYEAEAARLDALLRDIGEADWRAPVRLTWFDGRRAAGRDATVAGVIGHLTAVDGLVAGALGLPDPVGPGSPDERTEACWASGVADRAPGQVRAAWRDQGRSLIRTVSFADGDVADLTVPYGPFSLPLRDAFLDRAFECWVHAEDIADAVDYPYEPPSSPHLNRMIDLAARMLPASIAGRRRAGLAPPARTLVAAGTPGRALHLEIEGRGGGHWYIALDSPGALGTPEGEVAHVALDGVEFCRLAAGHVSPEEAAAGSLGDAEAVRDVLYATASLSRL
ncbi:maleylpyruvate isomerase family mycothiol-dependent enzyme [Streptomyces sp. NPDC053079]|uniref:maleylpyruvate isomerase family mycothiol-dependent enzyme n=1 Tax=Streptomyces sp. NPDC053079 TaxID=3365697 RepID=UPI0037CD5F7E